VIGASALSPPEVRPEVPYNIDPVAARRGYSDVGFRLAFPAGAPAGVLAGKVQEALASAVYIAPR